MSHRLHTVLAGALLAFGSSYGLASEMKQAAQRTVKSLAAQCSAHEAGTETYYPIEQRVTGNTQASRFLLVQVTCEFAAYNSSDKWILADEYGEASVLSFAFPTTNVVYASLDNSEVVKRIDVIGYSGRSSISNSHFDLKSLTITASHKWRGLGDAYDTAIWKFIDGEFVFQRLDIDAAFDGKDNPVTVVDFNFGGQ